MGDRFSCYLDVTIVYPKGIPTFWDLLCGKLEQVVVQVRELPIPETLAQGNYASDAGYRRELQGWVQGMWDEKDQFIADVLEARARTDII